MKTIAFIGGGNMATALINGLLADGQAAQKIIVADPDERQRERLAAGLGVRTTVDNQQAAAEAQIIVLAVKPQQLKTVAAALRPSLQAQQLCLSIAAGIRYASLKNWLGEVPIVRVMPNTPAMVQTGASGLYAPPELDEARRQEAEHIMRSVGTVVWLEDEAQMDVLTAVSGSGPAYFFLFMQCLQAAGEQLGLDAESSRLLVLQTALGAAKMALESPLSLQELKQSVTSPGGTTEQALRVFEQKQLDQIILQAVQAAAERSKTLSEELG